MSVMASIDKSDSGKEARSGLLDTGKKRPFVIGCRISYEKGRPSKEFAVNGFSGCR